MSKCSNCGKEGPHYVPPSLGDEGFFCCQPPIKSFSGEYRWLSNFWRVPITLDGELYPTVEHAYQAAKTLDHMARAKIQKLSAPSAAKRAGYKVMIRSDWEEIKLDVMYQMVKAKFSHQKLKDLLLETGDRDIIEGNSWGDTFWGVCDGEGENHLGKIIMRVREEYRNEAASAR